MSVSHEDIWGSVEFFFVNTVTASIIANWDRITASLQVILVITAIIYNITKIHSWYIDKVKKPRMLKRAQEEKSKESAK